MYRKIRYRGVENASTEKSGTGGVENVSTEKSSTIVPGWKMQVRKKQVQICKYGKCKYGKMKLVQASTDGATIDGSRCAVKQTLQNKHVNLRNNFKV